jgi:hypothetical protein
MLQVREWQNVTREVFEQEVVPAYQPAVLRGLNADWPAVAKALESPESICGYLKSFYRGRLVCTILGDPSNKGKISYQEGLRKLNFGRKEEAFDKTVQRLLAHAMDENPPTIAVQSAPLPDYFPGFSERNNISLFANSVVPRVWIGNAVTVSAHFDDADNIACVVAGKRRFTLFPPDQAKNLYVGPINFTPGGAPISLVDVNSPDLEKHPKFENALSVAQVADLGPGDAIYIPTLWWHHVESLEPVNVLVNYWSGGSIGVPKPGEADSAFDCLLHGLLTIKDLPQAHREAWRSLFDHYVFQTGDDPAAHLPAESRHVLGEITPELEKQLKGWLIRKLGG